MAQEHPVPYRVFWQGHPSKSISVVSGSGRKQQTAGVQKLQTNSFSEFIDIYEKIGSSDPPLQKFSTLLITFYKSQLFLT